MPRVAAPPEWSAWAVPPLGAGGGAGAGAGAAPLAGAISTPLTLALSFTLMKSRSSLPSLTVTWKVLSTAAFLPPAAA
jgi:hypothetical protein